MQICVHIKQNITDRVQYRNHAFWFNLNYSDIAHMKFFLIHLTYLKPIEVVQEFTDRHRSYLKTKYDEGILLFSGPRVPRTGGVLFAKAADISVINNIIAADPFATNGVAEYEVIEVAPTTWAEQIKAGFE